MSEAPNSPEDWARVLGAGWERRARSPSRDFFVASYADWKDPAAWDRAAQGELELMLTALSEAELADCDALEIGCGSGRLAPFLRPRVRSYTGFDIAPGMVEGAQERCRDLTETRFFVGDGLGVPEAARDRQYQLILCLAVFIHCPKDVIERNVLSAWKQLAPGGRFRFQVLADPGDPTGIEVAPPAAEQPDSTQEESAPGSEDSEAVLEEAQDIIDRRTPEEIELSSEEHYMGHAFGYEETREMMERLAPGCTLHLYRGHLYAIYGSVDKPG